MILISGVLSLGIKQSFGVCGEGLFHKFKNAWLYYTVFKVATNLVPLNM